MRLNCIASCLIIYECSMQQTLYSEGVSEWTSGKSEHSTGFYINSFQWRLANKILELKLSALAYTAETVVGGFFILKLLDLIIILNILNTYLAMWLFHENFRICHV